MFPSSSVNNCQDFGNLFFYPDFNPFFCFWWSVMRQILLTEWIFVSFLLTISTHTEKCVCHKSSLVDFLSTETRPRSETGNCSELAPPSQCGKAWMAPSWLVLGMESCSVSLVSGFFRSALFVKFIHSAHVAADHKFSLLHYVPLYEYTMIYLPILLSVGENVLFWAASRGLSDGLELLNHS